MSTHMTTHTPNANWKKLCPLAQLAELEELIRLKGQPDVSATETDMPPYCETAFQVVVRPDGIWTHARTAHEWGKRKFDRLVASCDAPSSFHLFNAR